MKYGVLCAKNTRNIGDDIQSFASGRFLPRIDYYVEREEISDFKSKNDEPVAVIMNAWWMWKKWNWPPSKCIIPKLISMHFTDWTNTNWGSSLKHEIFEGIGKEYMNSYGPVGCRDMHTLDLMKKYKIKAYFSGCMTLTLPKMPIKKSKKEYVCAVDISDDVINTMRKQLPDNIEIKKITHDLTEKNEKLTFDQREKNVKKLLTVYQNAKCVITSRLHVSLPCLALETPVLLVTNDLNCNRFSPYYDLLNHMTEKEFLNNEYDLLNPLENKRDYLKIRKSLIKEVEKFIEDTKNMDTDLDKLVKTKYSDEEKKEWQYNLMKDALEKWFYDSRSMLSEYNKTIDYLRTKEKQVEDYENSTSWKVTKPIRKIKELSEKLKRK